MKKYAFSWAMFGFLFEIPAQELTILWDAPFASPQNKIMLQLKSASNLDSMRLVCNGNVIQKHDFTQKRIQTWQDSVALDTGKMVLTCTAWAGTSKQQKEVIFYYQPETAAITYRAVLIGNSNYSREDSWANLNNEPIKDADNLAELLYQQYQFTKIEVWHDATLEQMHTTFRGLSRRNRPKEHLLIFYSGHGNQEVGVYPNPYFVPTDASGNDFKTQFSGATFLNYVAAVPSEHVLFIADAAFAGSLALNGTSNSRSDKFPKEVPKVRLKEEEVLERFASRQVISSANNDEVLNESLFMKHLLLSLDENQNKIWSAMDLFQKLRVSTVTDSGYMPQLGKMPFTGDQGGDFIFRKKI